MFLVLICINANAQWQPTNGPYGGRISCLAKNGSNIFAGSYCAIFLSTDNGVTWSKLNTGLPSDYDVTSFVINGSSIFAGTNRGIFLSINNGSTWSSSSTGMTIAQSLELTPKGRRIEILRC